MKSSLENALFLIALVLIGCVRSRKANLEFESNILNSLFKNYDSKIRPAGENSTSPLVIRVNMYIRRLDKVGDNRMVYDTQLTFRQSWVDSRLKYDGRGDLGYLTLRQKDKIWMPDLFFSNEVDGHAHDLITPNVLLRIFSDGKVLFSTRISLSLSCPMDLRNYPLDNQACSIITASYGYTTEDLVILWKQDDPVQISKNIDLPNFTLERFFTDYCTSKTNTGEYSCIKVDLLFSREFHHYFVTAYTPTAFLVILSWVVFWLNPNKPSLRMGLWVGVLISVIFVVNSISSDGPVVPYTKALDMWTGFCILFIFCVLIEICLTSNALAELEEESLTKVSLSEGKRHPPLRHYSSIPLKWLNKCESKAKRIDLVSRVMFPAAFALYIFIYWMVYSK